MGEDGKQSDNSNTPFRGNRCHFLMFASQVLKSSQINTADILEKLRENANSFTVRMDIISRLVRG